jgi:hypothetical protein
VAPFLAGDMVRYTVHTHIFGVSDGSRHEEASDVLVLRSMRKVCKRVCTERARALTMSRSTAEAISRLSIEATGNHVDCCIDCSSLLKSPSPP